jgi:hypothetical protein
MIFYQNPSSGVSKSCGSNIIGTEDVVLLGTNI